MIKALQAGTYFLFSLLSLAGQQRAAAQVTVGYSSVTSAVGSVISENTYRQRTIDQYEISGVNVEPIDGSSTFDRNTIWKIYDQNQAWSLSILDSNPRVDVNKQEKSTQLVQAGRRESVYSTISGPLYSTVKRQTLSPFASVQLPLIVPVSTSVFPEDIGSDANKNQFSGFNQSQAN